MPQAVERPAPVAALAVDRMGLPAWKGAKHYATRVREATRMDADSSVEPQVKAAKWREVAKIAKVSEPASARAEEWERYGAAMAEFEGAGR